MVFAARSPTLMYKQPHGLPVRSTVWSCGFTAPDIVGENATPAAEIKARTVCETVLILSSILDLSGLRARPGEASVWSVQSHWRSFGILTRLAYEPEVTAQLNELKIRTNRHFNPVACAAARKRTGAHWSFLPRTSVHLSGCPVRFRPGKWSTRILAQNLLRFTDCFGF